MLTAGYVIIIKHDGRDGSVYPVTTSACSVGRGLHNDIRFRVQSVSEEHCIIYTSEFQPVRSLEGAKGVMCCSVLPFNSYYI
jgi:pSer/pThr/pTyr-binding forkhead associated (FHA) protein